MVAPRHRSKSRGGENSLVLTNRDRDSVVIIPIPNGPTAGSAESKNRSTALVHKSNRFKGRFT